MTPVRDASCAKMVPKARTDQDEIVRSMNPREIMDRWKGRQERVQTIGCKREGKGKWKSLS